MSTLFSNTKLTFARLSPFNQLQRFLLSRRRSMGLKRITKEKLYTLQIQEEKLKKQLSHLNTVWKQSQKTIDNEVQKLTKKAYVSEQAKVTDQNFIQFIQTLEQTPDVDIKIEAISNVVQKIDGIQFKKVGKQVKHNIQSVIAYRSILENYLNKLETEIFYWKTQDSLEEIKVRMEGVKAA